MRLRTLLLALLVSACVGDHVSPGGRGDGPGGGSCDDADGKADCATTVACVRACPGDDEACTEDCYLAATPAACTEAEEVVECIAEHGKAACACE